MNESIRTKINTYRRRLQDERVNTGIFGAIFIVTVFLYGFLGLFPLVRTVFSKVNTLKELNMLNNNLHKRANNLSDLKANLSAASLNINELEKAISDRPGIENYMISLVDGAASVGFKQRNLIIQGGDAERGTVELRVSFQGSSSQTAALISSLESLQRLTVINDLNYNRREETANVEVALEVFYLPE